MYLHTLSNNQTAVTQFLTKPTSPLGEIPSQTGAEQRKLFVFLVQGTRDPQNRR